MVWIQLTHDGPFAHEILCSKDGGTVAALLPNCPSVADEAPLPGEEEVFFKSPESRKCRKSRLLSESSLARKGLIERGGPTSPDYFASTTCISNMARTKVGLRGKRVLELPTTARKSPSLATWSDSLPEASPVEMMLAEKVPPPAPTPLQQTAPLRCVLCLRDLLHVWPSTQSSTPGDQFIPV